MHRLPVALSLLFIVLLLGACARPWHHPDYTNSKQIEFHYNKDSTDCTVVSSDLYPLDKEAQDKEFGKCMERKGWTRSDPLPFFSE